MKVAVYIVFAILLASCGNPGVASRPGSPQDVAARYLEENYPGRVALDIDTSDSELATPDAFRVVRGDNGDVRVTSPSAAGLLYGACHLVRMYASGADSSEFDAVEVPAYSLRLLNHWDNLDGTVERGYAGRSIWRWDALPDSVSPDIYDYAMRCAAVGINGIVLNNVNASPRVLSAEYLSKVRALADVLRPYGLRTYPGCYTHLTLPTKA